MSDNIQWICHKKKINDLIDRLDRLAIGIIERE